MLAELPLPVGGLLADAASGRGRSSAAAPAREAAAATRLSGRDAVPDMSFLALSVIPSLKITDQGLVDVDRFELVPLEAE